MDSQKKGCELGISLDSTISPPPNQAHTHTHTHTHTHMHTTQSSNLTFVDNCYVGL